MDQFILVAQNAVPRGPSLDVIPLAVCLGMFALLMASYVLMKSWGSDLSVKKVVVTALSLVWVIPAILAFTFVIGRTTLELQMQERAKAEMHREIAEKEKRASREIEQQSAAISEVSHTEAEELPNWVRDPERSEISGGNRVFTSRQYATIEEARAEVIGEAERRVQDQIATEYGAIEGWKPPAHLVQTEAIRREHVQKLTRNLGPMAENATMYRVFAEIDDSEKSVSTYFYSSWRDQIVEKRLWALGAVLVMLTTILTATTSYFRLDTLTEGAYRRRLKLAGVSLVTGVGLVVGAVLPYVT